MSNCAALLEPTYRDFERLSGYLVREPSIREKERITAARLEAQYKKGMLVLHHVITFGCDVRKGHPMDCAALWETADPQFFEVGTVWTHVEHRRNGVQVNVVDELLRLDAAQGKSLFAISSARSFGAVVKNQGFARVTRESMPDFESLAESFGLPRSRIPSSFWRPSNAGVVEGERMLYLRLAS